jgi:hypothetical protein
MGQASGVGSKTNTQVGVPEPAKSTGISGGRAGGARVDDQYTGRDQVGGGACGCGPVKPMTPTLGSGVGRGGK